MHKRFGVAVGVLVTTSCIWASTASAATEVGSNCTANSGPPGNYTMLQLSQAGGSPTAAPAAGVVTKWKVNSALPLPPGFTFSDRMRVFRATGAPNEFQTIAQSTPGAIQSGANTFETQIPVQAGDKFGVFAPAGSYVPLCTTTSNEDKIGAVATDVAPGAKATYPAVEKFQLALSVTIEPDVDGDGFGDESQDKCPRNAKLQTECPLIALSSFGIASRNSALVLVASSSSAPVTVEATVTVPGKTKKGKKGKAKTLKLTGGTQTVAPGQLAQFVVAYSVPLKAALTALSPKKSLSLTVSASATDATGLPSSSATTLRLKGQAKPQKK
jgi:hypothetical protein